MRELVPVPIASAASSTIVSRPRSESSRAIARPTTPAPITTQSVCSIALRIAHASRGEIGIVRPGSPACRCTRIHVYARRGSESDRPAFRRALVRANVGRSDYVAAGEPRGAERVQQRAAHRARRRRGQHVEHVVVERVREAPPPRMRRANLVVDRPRDPPRARGIRRRDLVHVHPVQQRLRNRMRIVRGRDPDHVARVDRHFGEFVDERARGVMLEQRVQRAERIVLRIAAGLVDLVDCDHGIRIAAVDKRVEHLAGLRVLPLRRRTRQDPAGRQRTHRHVVIGGAEQLRKRLREMRLADPGRPEQQDRHQFEPVLRLEAQRDLLAHVAERLGEIGQRVVEFVERRHPVRLHAKAQIAGLEHPLVSGAQCIARALVQVVQCGFDLLQVVHRAEGRHRQFLFHHRRRHTNLSAAAVAHSSDPYEFSVAIPHARASKQPHASAANTTRACSVGARGV
ncbi:hypothetical protein BLAT2472_120047 [Burkholderia latens]